MNGNRVLHGTRERQTGKPRLRWREGIGSTRRPCLTPAQVPGGALLR